MILFKLIEIDTDKERQRIARVKFTPRQRKALLELMDLFEQGKWLECVNHVNNKDAFPYNESGEYPETEHIGVAIADILMDVAYHNYYTQEQLLDQARARLKTTN
jgi:hypothetical protein